jgi:hypothetical protein
MARATTEEASEHEVVEHAHAAEHDYEKSFEAPEVEKLDRDDEQLDERTGPVSHRKKHAKEDFATRKPTEKRA